ncbi:MAG: GspMb/PilO family protein [Acidimicrobiia bacterium]|nr:GspMb/PilO family protein [Acidimicrobiia bacterium]
MNPAPPSPSPGAPSVINLSMQIEGGFFQLLDYLNRLEDLDRLVVVDSLAINAQEQTSSPSPTLSVTLSGRMFTRATVTPAGGVTTTTTTAPGTPATAPTSTVEPIGEGS